MNQAKLRHAGSVAVLAAVAVLATAAGCTTVDDTQGTVLLRLEGTVTVLDTAGPARPVRGAVVTLRDGGDRSLATTLTDAAGRFAIPAGERCYVYPDPFTTIGGLRIVVTATGFETGGTQSQYQYGGILCTAAVQSFHIVLARLPTSE